MTNNRRICCFYDRVVGLADAREMISLWGQSWRSFGWEIYVLGMEHARAHPLFAKFNEHVTLFHSRNVGNYDHLCWLRWLAFANAGGGVMTDYDVINRCLISQDIDPSAPTIHEATRVPCMVSADASGAQEIVDTIFNMTPPKNRREHFSDMVLFQRSPYPHVPTCIEFEHAGWQEAKCVHFSRHAVHKWNKENKTGVRREDAVRRFMTL